MIEKNRKDQGHREEQNQYATVVRSDNQQEKEADHQDHNLRRDHIGENSAYKEPIFPLEQRQTVWTVVPNMKRMSNNC